MTASVADQSGIRSFGAARPPVAIAAAAHLFACVLAAATAVLGGGTQAEAAVFALTQAVFAAALGARFGLPMWWLPINLAFLPAALWLSQLALSPWWYLAGFLALASVYRTSVRSRVPLFLSSDEACEALIGLLPRRAGVRVLDLGCGIGTALIGIAGARPDAALHGSELAMLPALLARLRTRRFGHCTVRREDFWAVRFDQYDVVYAFLSPAVMAQLWGKARLEMKPGSLFVSNSFHVPGIEPDRIVHLAGRHSRALLVWRM